MIFAPTLIQQQLSALGTVISNSPVASESTRRQHHFAVPANQG